ncbi:hypothetical protein [Chitinimonas sp. BJB300]|uniref:hypothetical protein n=1 Tax=Chitinimonas sp. BJB300 TaxID=1559339 RepID=UPI000C106BBE|nr:hypothetical protein [Chitinimonas sp. BJB300]PHV13292.1 hypothetical protein CSQ89_01235 [Chitinimonas sp. BJB300]TSJ86003.1 hypothetical protein FG002_016685 [Chitinimonas sp. BJB300]
MTHPLPEAALEQYLDTLKLRGVSNKQLTTTRHFLRHLLSNLRDVSHDGQGYRAGADITLRNFPEEDQFRALIREFFPYWRGESTPTVIPQPVASPAIDNNLAKALTHMQADPWSQASLQKLELHAHQFRTLHRYGEELVKMGLEEANIQARMRLIKLLLYTMRDANPNTESYRTSVDQVLALLPSQDRWHVFVSLAREFFYFLANDQDAPSKLQRQLSTQELQSLFSA